VKGVKRIAIDMDEVTADTMAHFLQLYNREFRTELTTEHLHGRRVLEVIEPATRARAREYFQAHDFFADIPVMPGSQEVMEGLMKRYEVFITTAAMDVPCSFTPKFEWLARHFPFLPASRIVFCGDKSIVAADYLIDDDVRHFKRFSGEGILYTAPHNVHETAYRRVNDWEDIRAMFLG
jgi:5'(3')-deoxyribonucleotidase